MAIKIDARIENADWSRDAQLQQLEDDAQFQAVDQVLKHRPGGIDHDQTEHGNWSEGSLEEEHEAITPLTSGPLQGTNNMMENFPEKLQKSILKQSDTHLGTTQEITDRYTTLLEQAATQDLAETAQWRDWYASRHNWGSMLAQNSRFNTMQTLGMTSALSPGMFWPANQNLAEHMVEFMNEDPVFADLPGVDMEFLQEKLDDYSDSYGEFTLDAGTRFSDITNDNLAAVAWAEVERAGGQPVPAPYGYASIGDGIAIMRGANPLTQLRGVKTRSFYNNLLALPGDTDVTIDVHMLSAAKGTPITKALFPGLETKLNSTPSISAVEGNKRGLAPGKNSVGVRPHLADIIRNVTDTWNANPDNPWGQLEPRQVQAIIWTEWRNQHP